MTWLILHALIYIVPFWQVQQGLQIWYLSIFLTVEIVWWILIVMIDSLQAAIACPTVGVGANAYFMFIRFMYAKCAFLVYLYSQPLLTDISLRQTPCWNENLELVPAFLYSFWLTLYKTDISLSQTHMPVLKVSILETVLFNRDFFAYVFKKQTNKKARSLLTHQINVISCCLIKKEKIFFCPQNLIRTKTEVVFIY